MRFQENIKVQILILSILTFYLSPKVFALEIPNDYSSSVISQVATYVMNEIISSVRQKEISIMEVARKITSARNRSSVIAKLEKIRSHILLLEKGSIDKLRLSIVEPPVILKANENLEITVLAFFTGNGKNLRSCIMTFQLISPFEEEGKIKCGFVLGHVCFSTSEIVQ